MNDDCGRVVVFAFAEFLQEQILPRGIPKVEAALWLRLTTFTACFWVKGKFSPMRYCTTNRSMRRSVLMEAGCARRSSISMAITSSPWQAKNPGGDSLSSEGDDSVIYGKLLPESAAGKDVLSEVAEIDFHKAEPLP